MNHRIVIEHKDDYIHVRYYGKINYDTSLDLWRQIVAACKEYNCYKILGESYTEVMSTMDSFEHSKIFQLAGVTIQHRIAWVAHGGDEKYRQVQFIETVLRNRGLLQGALFPTVEEAKSWLLGPKDDVD